jgi:hypothetical protein
LSATTPNAHAGARLLIAAPISLLSARGVDVLCNDLKFRVAGSGNLSLQISTASGSASLVGRATAAWGASNTSSAPLSMTVNATPTYVNPAYTFTAGEEQGVTFVNLTTGKSYRVTAIFTADTAQTLISVERLS